MVTGHSCLHALLRPAHQVSNCLFDELQHCPLSAPAPAPAHAAAAAAASHSLPDMFEMLFGWHGEAAITSPSHGSIIFSTSPQIPVVLCHRTHVTIPHLQPPPHDGGLHLDSPFAAFVLSINGHPVSMGGISSASHSCTTARPGWGRHTAVLEWFNVAEEWQSWWQQHMEQQLVIAPQLLSPATEVDRALHACCSAMGSLLAFCAKSFKSRHAGLAPADVAECPFVHASGVAGVVFSVADSAVPLPPVLQQFLVSSKYVDASHVFTRTKLPAADAAVQSALPVIEALAGDCSRCLNPLRRFIIAAVPPSPTESLFNPCVILLRDGTFRFTARAHDLSDKFLLTRRRSRVVAGIVAANGRPVTERDLLHSADVIFTAIGMHNISVTGSGNPPPFCSPGEQDARVLAHEDDDGCSLLFMFAPHRHLPSRGGIAAVRHCWPLLRPDVAAAAASDTEAPSHQHDLSFIWLSHSAIEKNWPIWRAAASSSCGTIPDSSSSHTTCDTASADPPPPPSHFLFARSIEPHDVFTLDMDVQAASGAGGIVSHVAATSARGLKWFHDNTPFWIHGGTCRYMLLLHLNKSYRVICCPGSPPVLVPYASSCVASRDACHHRSNSTVMIAVGHAKDPFTFTYVNFLYAFSSSPPYAVLGWVPLDLEARVTMGM